MKKIINKAIVKLDKEFFETYYKCPNLAKYIFLDYQKRKNIKLFKYSNFTKKNYILTVYSKIMSYVFYKFIEDSFCDFNITAEIMIQILKSSKKEFRFLPDIDKINNEIMENLNNVFKMFERNDSYNCMYKTVKDTFLINNLIGDLMSETNNKGKLNLQMIKKIKTQYEYEIEIPFIISKDNSKRSCVPIIFVYGNTKNSSYLNDINLSMIFLYILENTNFTLIDEIIFYDFKNFKRTVLPYNNFFSNKAIEVIKIISQIEFGLLSKNTNIENCCKCLNLEYCQKEFN